MGCCCGKQSDDEEQNERDPLLGEDRSKLSVTSQITKSEFNNTISNLRTSSTAAISTTDNYHHQSYQNESNHILEKLLNEVIQVTTVEQRTNATQDITNNMMNEAPSELKGLREPSKQSLTLPEGVAAPITVLSAQPPFINDIKLINKFALEANACINNYTLQVPANVAFDFNPIV